MASDVMQHNGRKQDMAMTSLQGGDHQEHSAILRQKHHQYKKQHPHSAHPSTHVSTVDRRTQNRPEGRGTSVYLRQGLDAEAREDEEERLEREEKDRIRRHKNKNKGDGTISGRYMRETFLQYDDDKGGRKSVKLRDANELKNGKRLREIRAVKSLMIEDESDAVTKLPDTLTDMSHIDELIIKYCKTKSLPDKITNLNKVTTLTLNETHLKDMEVICKLSSLKHLNVSNNALKAVPRTIGNLRLLENLNISGNHILILPSQMGSLSNLLHLNVASNKLHHIPDSLCKLSNMRSIDASRNVLEALPEDLGNLSSLTELNVGHNKLDYMPESLRSLRKLRYLYAPRNRLTEMGDGFTDLVAVENLHLQENGISTINGCPPNVAVLLINDNKLSDVSLLWRTLRKIRTMSLRNNDIAELPQTVMAGAGSLRSLYLDDNPLEFLPDTLSQNIQLCHLTVSNTKVPHIPHGILHLPKLSLLDVTNNRLDAQLQSAAARGIDELRKAYDNFVPNDRPQIPVSLRRSASKTDGSSQQNRSSVAMEEKRSSWRPAESTLTREGKRSMKGSSEESTENRTMQRQKSQEEKKSPREGTLPREDKNPTGNIPPQETASNSPSTQKRLPRSSMSIQENPVSESNNNIVLSEKPKPPIEKPKPATKPKSAVVQMQKTSTLEKKPDVSARPAVSSKPQVNGGQKSSFLFSRPT